jgi:caffeoyl-CoA O-methyltransferase
MDLQKLEDYAINHTTPESFVIKELLSASEEDLEHTDMLSGRLVSRLLAMLIKISGAKRVLEVGTFTGYSALMMAEPLPEDGKLFTCEYNQRYKDIAKHFFEESDAGSKIEQLWTQFLR